MIYYKNAKRIENRYQASLNTESTLNQLLDKLDVQDFSESTSSSYTYQNGGSSQYDVDLWGSFWRIGIKSQQSGQKHSDEYLFGQRVPDEYNYSFVALNQDAPLNVTGETVITDSIKTGKRGLLFSSYGNQAFIGAVTDTVLSETFNKLPTETDHLLSFLNALNHSCTLGSNLTYPQTRVGEQYVAQDSLLISNFSNSDLLNNEVILSQRNIRVCEDVELPPFTILIADSLMIEGDVKGKNLILFGRRYVSIKGNTSISAQIFSNGEVVIADSARIKYPSVIFGDPIDECEFLVSMEDKSSFAGTILYLESEKKVGKLLVAEDSVIDGFVYFEGKSNILGTVNGNCIVKDPFFKKKTTTYLNWLKEGNYNLTNRMEPFIIPLVFDKANEIVR